MHKTNIILCGLPGVGKTTIGKHCAQILERPFLDTDQILEATYGLSCRELFLREGRKKFRSYETTLLKNLSPMSDHVIALGGGAIEEEENRQLILHLGVVIHLTCDIEILIERKVLHDTPAFLELARFSRTDLSKDGQDGVIDCPNLPSMCEKTGLYREAEFRSLAAYRLPLYEEVKDFDLDVSRLSSEKIIKFLRETFSELDTSSLKFL